MQEIITDSHILQFFRMDERQRRDAEINKTLEAAARLISEHNNTEPTPVSHDDTEG